MRGLGLRYPISLVIIVFFSLLATSIVFEHHDVLVRVTNKHIRLPSRPSILTVFIVLGPRRRTSASAMGENTEQPIRSSSDSVLCGNFVG
ncbi:uncharacterized protein BJ212DRAFT_1379290 [Suillus subaureus]|uniref:Uncharacterized protein n=1 Tax=Suillus subaureus TaxID=48587 RepID=A0A9P7J923_9AGAM|nr:uncharacterized protein BJ212DRAFT_1391768 [Suillus subaureus]XP_041189429.1 uncharacterized protein BJ212DRAFT_1379290 [Suillus subaureus]KAG1805438.1 hypothetical protein BJ212DRAFT_1391768 [Suillus subaureus]KAG1809715.1 hypothetical protein BJ212DRAFT_1379290 [Suillus subaureus]